MFVDAKITSKNQTTIPREVRAALHVGSGDRVRYMIGDTGVVTVRKLTGSFADLRGIIDIGRPVSTDEILDMVREARDGIARQGRNGSGPYGDDD